VSGNIHEATVRAFGSEWSRFDHHDASEEEMRRMFAEYFEIFPWDRLPDNARGADIGCGTGRWARLAAPRVGALHCIDASPEALEAARRNLGSIPNVVLHHASVDSLPFPDDSLDFAYSLGVLHHVPDTAAALRDCVRKLKRSAPFLVYLYYAFDNRPLWYRSVWMVSEVLRRRIARMRPAARDFACDALAATLYWPLARAALLAEALGFDVSPAPLSMYRGRTFYSMRTDARDRFGTPLEKRFTAGEIHRMMGNAGHEEVRFSASPPYWCAVGIRSAF
jgi:ubiquinone/menaquinone biosynthesis C-methylase UbiE